MELANDGVEPITWTITVKLKKWQVPHLHAPIYLLLSVYMNNLLEQRRHVPLLDVKFGEQVSTQMLEHLCLQADLLQHIDDMVKNQGWLHVCNHNGPWHHTAAMHGTQHTEQGQHQLSSHNRQAPAGFETWSHQWWSGGVQSQAHLEPRNRWALYPHPMDNKVSQWYSSQFWCSQLPMQTCNGTWHSANSDSKHFQLQFHLCT